MHRLMLFTETPVFHVSTILMDAIFKAVSARNDMQIAAVCFRHPVKYWTLLARHGLALSKHHIIKAIDRNKRYNCTPPIPLNMGALSSRYGFPVVSPPNGDLNAAEFIAHIKQEIRPTVALSFYCLQKYGPALLKALHSVTNYHNGRLPHYRGVRATHWSLYSGDQYSGFTFHYMDSDWDTGPVLIEDAIAVGPCDSIADLELKKARKAAERMPQLMEMLTVQAPGIPQSGPVHHYYRNDFFEITTINDPASLSCDEILRRMRAFEFLLIKIGGAWHHVTRMEKITSPPPAKHIPFFTCSDGVLMAATRFYHLPWRVYRLFKPVLQRMAQWRQGVNRLMHGR